MADPKLNQANPMRFWHEDMPQGAQSGPAQESSSAYLERLLQFYGGMGLGGAGALGGNSIAGPIGGAAGMVPGFATMLNAENPNIQDVWAHQLMQAMRKPYLTPAEDRPEWMNKLDALKGWGT